MMRHVPAGYALEREERNNVVFLVLKYVWGWAMRQADFEVVEFMAEQTDQSQRRGSDAVEHLIRATCEYAWSHICGEPADVPLEQAIEAAYAVLDHWYANTPEALRKDNS